MRYTSSALMIIGFQVQELGQIQSLFCQQNRRLDDHTRLPWLPEDRRLGEGVTFRAQGSTPMQLLRCSIWPHPPPNRQSRRLMQIRRISTRVPMANAETDSKTFPWTVAQASGLRGNQSETHPRCLARCTSISTTRLWGGFRTLHA